MARPERARQFNYAGAGGGGDPYASLRLNAVSQWAMVGAADTNETDTIGGFTAAKAGTPGPGSATLTGAVKVRRLVSANGNNFVVNPATQYNLYPLTIRVWIKTADAMNDLLEHYNAGNGWRLFLNTGEIGFYYYAGGSHIDGGYPSGAVNDNTLHQIVIVVDVSGANYYLDGALLTTVAWTGSPVACTYTGVLNIGGDVPGGGPVLAYDGDFAPVLIVAGAWDASQVLLDWHAGVPLIL